jgi:hypothetical protein
MSEREKSELRRPAAVLAGLLCALGREVYRTKFVKLAYLLDESNFRLHGETMTGFNYIWDNYGPNADDNDIVVEMDKMIADGVLTMSTHAIMGNPAYRYQINPECSAVDLPLSSDDWTAIHTVVHKYGSLNREKIVAMSKATEPMRNARQGDDLVFVQDAPLTEDVIASDPFWAETLEAMANPGKRIPLVELQSGRA